MGVQVVPKTMLTCWQADTAVLDNSWWSQALVPENMSRGKPLECFSLGEVDGGLSCKPTF